MGLLGQRKTRIEEAVLSLDATQAIRMGLDFCSADCTPSPGFISGAELMNTVLVFGGLGPLAIFDAEFKGCGGGRRGPFCSFSCSIANGVALD